jgi:hypothetical protein
MSDPLAASLSKFHPDASGLDQSALLFAAGRASARPDRRWVALAGALAATQLTTLLFLCFQPPGAATVTPTVPNPLVDLKENLPEEQAVAPDGPKQSMLREVALATEGNLPSPGVKEPLVPSDPPLNAFTGVPSDFLQ